jgi:hypothetical protein
VFARSDSLIVRSNPSQGMDVCVCAYSVCVRSRPYDGPIPRPRSPTDSLRLRENKIYLPRQRKVEEEQIKREVPLLLLLLLLFNFVIITILLSSLFRCYNLPCFVLCIYFFLSVVLTL